MRDELTRLTRANEGTKFRDITANHTIVGHTFDLRSVKNTAGTTAFDRMAELMATVRPAGKSRNFHDELAAVMQGSRYQLGKDNPGLDGTPLMEGLRQTLVRSVEHDYREAALQQVAREYKQYLFPGETKSLAQIEAQYSVAKRKSRVGAVANDILNFGK